MNYTDLHCDTAYEIYLAGARLNKNNLHIDMEKAKVFDYYTQVYAIWSDNKLSDNDTYAQFFQIREYLLENMRTCGIDLCLNGQQYMQNKAKGIKSAFLAIEGGASLSNNIDRLDILYNSGVRFLTLVWKGMCKIGGAHDTEIGLTEFGKEVVKRCYALGIIIDVSHLSEHGFYDVAELSEKPFIATHSNSKTVCPHSRNLTDEQFKIIVNRGGVVGINMCAEHIGVHSDVVDHIEHYLSLGGENAVCFGCDFDGAVVADGINNVSDILKFPDKLAKRGYSDSLINKIMYRNADRFLESAWIC